MDNFTFGQFGDLDAYNAREEMGGERGDNTPSEEWVEPMDFGDLLYHNQRHLDLDWEEIDEQERQKEEDDWWNY